MSLLRAGLRVGSPRVNYDIVDDHIYLAVMEDDKAIVGPGPSDPGTSVHDDLMAGEELATLPPAQMAGSETGNLTLHTHDGYGPVEPELIPGAASGDPAHWPAGTGAQSLSQFLCGS